MKEEIKTNYGVKGMKWGSKKAKDKEKKKDGKRTFVSTKEQWVKRAIRREKDPAKRAKLREEHSWTLYGIRGNPKTRKARQKAAKAWADRITFDF